LNAQVVTVCSHNRPELYYRPDSFIESLARFAEKPTILGSTTPFMGLMTKAFLYRDWLRAGNNTSDRLILCDAFDILFLAHPHGIGDRCQEWFGDAVVFNGEKSLWPCGHLADDFPDTGPYRYLNSGFICGPADKILAMFESMDLESIGVDRANPDGSRTEPNDQGEIQKIFGKQPVKMVVDGTARLAMTFSATEPSDFELRDRVLHNRLTGTTPGVAHFNGSGFNNYHHLFRAHWEFKDEKGPIPL